MSVTFRWYSIALAAILLLTAGCQSDKTLLDQPTEPTSPTVINESGVTPQGESYPGPMEDLVNDESYPGVVAVDSRDFQQDPPDPSRELPEAKASTGVIGGVLIEEVEGKGYTPLHPLKFMLGKILLANSGQPSYIRTGEDSVKAELFPSGVFIFHSVEPGDYGLVVDLGFTSFVINGEDGSPLVITVEPGSVIDLGQVITKIPSS